jgi:CheY-like chemotaxis protein
MEPQMPLRILIAEDDDLQGALLEGALRSRGYDTEIAINGLEAVRRLRTGRFDLALIDFNMPEINGLAAARLTQDLLTQDERPQMIAITASAEKLHAEHELGVSGCFDAIVSKRASLPALLTVIETNLSHREERRATLQLRASSLHTPRRLRNRRLLGLLCAGPALAMAAAFAVAAGLATTSLTSVQTALGATQNAEALTANTAALIDTMQDAETSQRSYLASGSASDRAQFEADAQRVDQLLASRAPMSADNSPGFSGNDEPLAVIEPRLKSLAAEVQQRAASTADSTVAGDAGRSSTEQLRSWASTLLGDTLGAAQGGLALVRSNIYFVLVILAFGVLYSLWNARQIIRRRALISESASLSRRSAQASASVAILPRTHPTLLLDG